jgi:Tol biopolymer transport system component
MRIEWVTLGVVAVLACGSTTPDTGDASTDAASDVVAADAGDAAAETGPLCDLTKPFGSPVPVAALDTPEDELFARLTHDELTVYFERYPSADAGIGGSDLYVASRSSVSAAFGSPTLLSSLHAQANQFDPTPTGDDRALYFASDRAGGAGGADLWGATRASTTAAFGNVVNLTALNTANNEHTPYVMADGMTLYFCSEATVATIARATRTQSTPFAADTSGLLAAVNATGDSLAPAVTPDELTLYFASDRTGSKGPLDIWKATRGTTSDPWGGIANVTELNTTGTDVPDWISDDGCRMYLHNDSAGSLDIYVATKGP